MNPAWKRRFFAIDGPVLKSWDTYDSYHNQEPPVAVFNIPDCKISTGNGEPSDQSEDRLAVSVDSFDPSAGPGLGIGAPSTTSLRAPPRIKLHFGTRFLELEARSQNLADAWAEMLIEAGARRK